MYKILYLPTSEFLKVKTENLKFYTQVNLPPQSFFLEEELNIASYLWAKHHLIEISVQSKEEAEIILTKYISGIPPSLIQKYGDIFTNRIYFDIIEM